MNRRLLLAAAAGVAVVGGGAVLLARRSMGSMAGYEAAIAASRAPLPDRPQTRDLIRYATLAANGHNTQPWIFEPGADGITIRPDPSRRTPVVDPDDHHVFVSLGCAAENLALAAGSRGRPGRIGFDPAAGGSVRFIFEDAPPAPSLLFDAIPRRQSTRAEYDGRPVAAAELRLLEAAAAVPGVDLVLLTDRPRIESVQDLVIVGNTAQMADPAFLRELKHWLRFSPRQAAATCDGLFSAASGKPILPAALGPPVFDWFVSGEDENDAYARQIRSSAGLAVFVAARADPEHWMQVGRACQRFALQATALGLKHAFLNQPVEVPALRPELAGLIGLADRRPDLVMRFGHGPTLPFSARRAVSATPPSEA